jgi:hypothetical protein
MSAIARCNSKIPLRIARPLLVTVSVLGSLFICCGSAFAFLGSEEYDISSFCNEPAARRTLVYIDDRIMEDQNTSWANRLFQKLNSSLLPNEAVSVIQLSPSVGTAKEVWSACWPDYSQDERDKLAKQSPWFSKKPLKVLETQQAVFRQQFGAALTRIYTSEHRPKREIVESYGRKKGLVAAIMSDESRFHSARSSARIIFYSDMLEISEYADVTSSGDFEKLGSSVSRKLKFDSDGASIYVFGVVDTSEKSKQAVDNARDFWTAFFKHANGYVRGFGSELNIPGSQPTMSLLYELEAKVRDTPRFGRIRLFSDSKGQLQDSFIFFTADANSPIEGTFQCRTADRCTLDARTIVGTVTLSSREELKLEGPMQKLKGSLGFPNDIVAGEKDAVSVKANFEVNATLRTDR